jgi:flagellin
VNALTVADGAMSTVADILQRMRSLVVEARSDLESTADRGDIQQELNQLTLEINRIAENTTFNGRNLLDGSASSQPVLPPRVIIETNSGLAGGGYLLDTTLDPNQPNVVATAPQLAQQITIDSVDPLTGNLNLTVVIGSQDATFGPEQSWAGQVAPGTNYNVGGPAPMVGQPTFHQADANFNPVLSFNIGTLSANDVGASAFLITLPAQQKAPGSALQVNTGAAEGSVATIDIPGLSAANLGVNEVILGDDLENQAAEYRIDYAISALGGIRATVGAQTVSLQEAATNNQITSVNTQASESAIRDANIGQTMTQFVRDQILVNFQSRLVADAETLSKTYATLVSDAFVL